MSFEDPEHSAELIRRPAARVRRRALRRDDGLGAAAVVVVLGLLSIAALVVVVVAGIAPDDDAPDTARNGVWLPGAPSFPPPAIPIPLAPEPSASGPPATRPAATRTATSRPATWPSTTRPMTPALQMGTEVSLEPAGQTGLRLRHRDFRARIDRIGPRSTGVDRADATFRVRAGPAGRGCVSFEAVNFPGRFLRHRDFVLVLDRDDGSDLFRADVTFCPAQRAPGGPVVLRSVNYPDRHLAARADRVELVRDEPTAFTIQPPP